MSAQVPQPTEMDMVEVRTTLPLTPFPTYDTRQVFSSERLVLRDLKPTDLDLYARLRGQPETMKWTMQGRPDSDMESTRNMLEKMLPPNDVTMFNFAICLKETDEFIGLGGCHKTNGELGWPVIGYMFRSEFWGQGFATEFLNCFLGAWWSLPRQETTLAVDRETAKKSEAEGLCTECIIAVTVEDNIRSQKVLRKCGLQLVKIWSEPDSHDETKDEVLYAFAATRS
ncbi:acetyltransferase (GNAT) domain-containing protein [Sarocladium implicatum]|nr:acetyltransferase (GNAT) domain-containing protein [Sarocladium implicatum]